MVAKSQKWRENIVKLESIKIPTPDTLETLSRRERWLRYRLASGLTGKDYQKAYLELMSIRVLLKETLADYFEKEKTND